MSGLQRRVERLEGIGQKGDDCGQREAFLLAEVHDLLVDKDGVGEEVGPQGAAADTRPARANGESEDPYMIKDAELRREVQEYLLGLDRHGR
ncbi:hypothetical protein KJ925_04955 [Patescibacteria group bacterium]|nr:hypothetical protein [Patescibacteria group bacterium]